MKILLTAGATREPIDAVRFLSNVSTGRTGAALADELAQRGHTVTLLHGAAAILPRHGMEMEAFSSADDLRQRLKRRLAPGDFDAVVMAAAVADYRPAEISGGKISSDALTRTLQLVRNEKILPQLKSFTARPLRVIGFKLTVSADDAARRVAVASQFSTGGVDAVVHNDLAEIRAGAAHPFLFWRTAADTSPTRIAGEAALAAAILEWLTDSVP